VVGINELTLGQVKEIADSIKGAASPKELKFDGGLRIVVLQRGWVVVGHYSRVGDNCRLENSMVISRWGTTKGLGQLAKEGPLAETKLEPSGLCEFHRAAEVFTLVCESPKWSSVCSR
jgi:hypothetical protein